jgi:hypothetical protein
MEYLKTKVRLRRREVLIGALVLFGAGAAAGGIGVSAFERQFQELPLKPEHGDAESNLTVQWLPETVSRWKPQIEKYSRNYDIDPNLTAILMTLESGGDPNASSGVANGLMQITDLRAGDINSKYLHEKRDSYDLKDPETNIEFGVANIKALVNEFGGSEQGPSWDTTVALVAAGYNGGEGAANDYFKGGLQGLKYQETYTYVRYATTMWRERHDDKSFAYRSWYDQGNGQALVRNAETYQLPASE